MSRFEFRVWIGDKIMPLKGANWDKTGSIYRIAGFCLDSSEVWGTTDPTSNFDIMQSTGLLDRNKKEIWEGDIVSWSAGRRMRNLLRDDIIYGVVVWGREFPEAPNLNDTGFFIDEKTDGWYSFKKDVFPQGYLYLTEFYGCDGAEFIWSELEVIGNRWENPELLDNITNQAAIANKIDN